MNKVKRIKNENYTTISNVFLRDGNLSLKAKGLLAMVLALPDDWDFSINGICALLKEGKTAVYSTIDELKEYGYCSVEVVRNERGVIIGNDYTFIEQPHIDYPHTENPHAENPNMDNQPQQNIEYKECSIDNIINKKEKYKKEKDETFEKCWIAYRRKGSKKKAMVYWDKLSPNEQQNVLPHITAYVSSRDVQYQKDFERYLRDKTFHEVVYYKNQIVYDPTKLGIDGNVNTVYTPSGNYSISWDVKTNAYMYIGLFFDGMQIADGYSDDNRPNNATLVLNNGRGVVTWNSETKKWERT